MIAGIVRIFVKDLAVEKFPESTIPLTDCLILHLSMFSSAQGSLMLLHVSSRAMVLSLVAMASLWLAFHSPLLGILWGLLTGVLSFLTFIAVLFGGLQLVFASKDY